MTMPRQVLAAALLSVGVCAAVQAVPAGAAALTVTAQAATERIEAETGVQDVRLHVEADCTSLMLRQDPFALGAIEGFAEVVPAANVFVSGPTTFFIDTTACTDGAETAGIDVDYQVFVSRLAPGLVPLAVRWSVRLEDADLADQAGDEAAGEASASVTALPFLLLEVKLDDKLIRTHGGQALVNVTLENFGNVPARIEFAEGSGSVPGGALAFPTDLRLDRPETTGRSATVPIAFTAPAQSWAQIAKQFTVTPVAEDGTRGQTLTANVLFVNAGAEERKSPGPGLALALPALGLLAARRRGVR